SVIGRPKRRAGSVIGRPKQGWGGAALQRLTRATLDPDGAPHEMGSGGFALTDLTPTRWEPDRTPPAPPWPVPPALTALARGATNRCPACGRSKLFRGFLRVAAACP